MGWRKAQVSTGGREATVDAKTREGEIVRVELPFEVERLAQIEIDGQRYRATHVERIQCGEGWAVTVGPVAAGPSLVPATQEEKRHGKHSKR